MAELHNGILNTLYGSLHTDEHFNKELQHVMKRKREGFELLFYRDKFNRIKVKRGGEWWVMTTLAEYDDFYKA